MGAMGSQSRMQAMWSLLALLRALSLSLCTATLTWYAITSHDKQQNYSAQQLYSQYAHILANTVCRHYETGSPLFRVTVLVRSLAAASVTVLPCHSIVQVLRDRSNLLAQSHVHGDRAVLSLA